MAVRRRVPSAGLTLACFCMVVVFLYAPRIIQCDVGNLWGIWSSKPILSVEDLAAHVSAIMNPDDAAFDRLECPAPNFPRYGHLRPDLGSPTTQTRYLFALSLQHELSILPRLMGSVVEAIQFLGPEHCALSMVVGHSPDGTAEVLAAVESGMYELGIAQTHFVHDDTLRYPDPESHGTQVKARNQALRPLMRYPERYSHPNTTVVFLDGVALCMEDILELLHQRQSLGADMTCGMDWTFRDDKPKPIFHDVQASRSMVGDTFFKIPSPDVSWDFAHDMFWDHPPSWDRFNDHRPFQVFSCWNGVVAFGAAPVIQNGVAFREPKVAEDECANGETHLFSKDLWLQGHGNILVVPTINVATAAEEAKEVKKEKGYVSQWLRREAEAEPIKWQPPPDQIKCMPDFSVQTWRPWNETSV